MKLNLTKASVDALPNPEKGQVFYYDTKLPGFGVYVMKTCKTYFVEARVNGKTVRSNIGRHGVYFPDRARDEARELLVRMSKGENPNTKVNTQQTLKSVLDAYLTERSTGQGIRIKEKTLEGYSWLRDTPLAPWHDTRQEDISPEFIKKIHKKLTEDNGPVCANNALRVIRAACNYLDILPNPVNILTKKRLWNPEKRRSRFIESGNVSEWLKKAEGLSLVMRGVVLTLLFTGMRKNEVLTLKKSQYRQGALFLSDTKNNDEHMVPVGPYLKARLDPLMKLEGVWLFPSTESEVGHVIDPRKALGSLGEAISPHDLRRTFVTHLNALEPAPSAYTIKRLMNHRQTGDVTAGYIQLEEKKLRDVITRLESSMVGTSQTT